MTVLPQKFITFYKTTHLPRNTLIKYLSIMLTIGFIIYFLKKKKIILNFSKSRIEDNTREPNDKQDITLVLKDNIKDINSANINKLKQIFYVGEVFHKQNKKFISFLEGREKFFDHLEKYLQNQEYCPLDSDEEKKKSILAILPKITNMSKQVQIFSPKEQETFLSYIVKEFLQEKKESEKKISEEKNQLSLLISNLKNESLNFKQYIVSRTHLISFHNLQLETSKEYLKKDKWLRRLGMDFVSIYCVICDFFIQDKKTLVIHEGQIESFPKLHNILPYYKKKLLFSFLLAKFESFKDEDINARILYESYKNGMFFCLEGELSHILYNISENINKILDMAQKDEFFNGKTQIYPVKNIDDILQIAFKEINL